VIYVVDPFGFENHGHHWHFSVQMSLAIIELGEHFEFISPTANRLFGELGCVPNQNLFSAIETHGGTGALKQKLFDLISELNSNQSKSVILFTWLPIFTQEEFVSLLRAIKNPNLSIVGVTSLSDESCKNYDDNYFFTLEQVFIHNNNCKILWVWHEPNPLTFDLGKVRRLPEHHSHVLTKVDTFRSVNQLSFFGRLSFSRGFTELLIIALMNPSLRIFAKGLGYKNSGLWRPSRNYHSFRRNPIKGILSIVISYGFSLLMMLPNVKIDTKPFMSESEFNLGVSNSHFVFVGCKSPLSSGVALSALASGVPVIWFGKEGEAVNNLKRSCVLGRINYLDIFTPGKITRKVKNLRGFKPKEVFTWEMFKEELIYLKQFT
jgi:hypothetical protein